MRSPITPHYLGKTGDSIDAQSFYFNKKTSVAITADLFPGRAAEPLPRNHNEVRRLVAGIEYAEPVSMGFIWVKKDGRHRLRRSDHGGYYPATQIEFFIKQFPKCRFFARKENGICYVKSSDDKIVGMFTRYILPEVK